MLKISKRIASFTFGSSSPTYKDVFTDPWFIDDDDVVVAGVGAGDAAALGFSFSSFSFSFSFSGCFDSVVEVGTLEVASDVTGAGVSAGGFAVAAGCVAATSDDMVSGNVSFFFRVFWKAFLVLVGGRDLKGLRRPLGKREG
jgi:hypothetical protein